MRTKINLNSGSILELDYASQKSVMKLIRVLASCIQKEIKDFKLDSSLLNTDLKDFKMKDDFMSKLLPIIS